MNALQLPIVVASVLRERRKASARSPHWPAVRRAHLKEHGECAICLGTTLLQVHHVEPFHLHPELELDPGNLVTLCTWKLHHLSLGHGGDFECFNPGIRADIDAVATMRAVSPVSADMVVEACIRNAKINRRPMTVRT